MFYCIGYNSKYKKAVLYRFKEEDITLGSWYEIDAYYKKDKVLLTLEIYKFDIEVSTNKIQAIKSFLNRQFLTDKEKKVYIRYLCWFYPEELL